MLKTFLSMMAALVVLGAALTACGGTADEDTSTTAAVSSGGGETVWIGGQATLTDVGGDVRDVDGGELPDGAWEADLTGATIRISGTDLELTVEQSEPIPSELDPGYFGPRGWLMYTLFIADTDGVIRYMPRVQLVGSEWRPEVYDAQVMESKALQAAPVISGTTLTYTFPLSLLPELEATFQWAVGTEWSIGAELGADELVIFGDQSPTDNSDGFTGYPYEWAAFPE